MMRLLYNPEQFKKYELHDRTFFIINNYQDQLLLNGSYGTANPKKQGELYNTLEELLKFTFKGNVKRMSEVLTEVYGKPEYSRQGLYKLIPSLREIKATRSRQKRLLRAYLKYFSTSIDKQWLREQLCKDQSIREIEEELGVPTNQEERIRKKVKTND